MHERSRHLPATEDASRVVAIAIATPIEAELVASIRVVSDRVSVLYQPERLPPTRYPEDQRGYLAGEEPIGRVDPTLFY